MEIGSGGDGRAEVVALVTPLFPDPLPRNLHFEIQVAAAQAGRASHVRVETLAPGPRTVRFVARPGTETVVASDLHFDDATPLHSNRPLAERLSRLFAAIRPALDGADLNVETIEARLTASGATVTCASPAFLEEKARVFRFDARDRLFAIEMRP